MSDQPDLVEACRAQIAACRELAYARQVLAMAGDGPDQPKALARYREALAAAEAATRVSDAAQSQARAELPDETQPSLW